MKAGTNHTDESQQTRSASSLHQEGFRCSQAVLGVYSEKLGLGRELALKIATGFGAGICRQGDVCGAVTGAVMVIGLKFGQTRLEDEKAKEITYYLVQEFIERFKSRHRYTNCKELSDCDLSTPEGSKRFRDEKINQTVCNKFIEDAEEILNELLDKYDNML
ncbi:C_GCAxxG_C_C family protein [bacterium]|nr:MAG: C_GCAxxG_C_C family protein [bacterium]